MRQHSAAHNLHGSHRVVLHIWVGCGIACIYKSLAFHPFLHRTITPVVRAYDCRGDRHSRTGPVERGDGAVARAKERRTARRVPDDSAAFHSFRVLKDPRLKVQSSFELTSVRPLRILGRGPELLQRCTTGGWLVLGGQATCGPRLFRSQIARCRPERQGERNQLLG